MCVVGGGAGGRGSNESPWRPKGVGIGGGCAPSRKKCLEQKDTV